MRSVGAIGYELQPSESIACTLYSLYSAQYSVLHVPKFSLLPTSAGGAVKTSSTAAEVAVCSSVCKQFSGPSPLSGQKKFPQQFGRANNTPLHTFASLVFVVSENRY